MADFNQATTSLTRENLTPIPSPTVVEGANNTGFGISPTYVNASEFAVSYLQASTSLTRQEIDTSIIRYLFAKPTDGRVVQMKAPLPTEIATKTVAVVSGIIQDNGTNFNLYYFED